MALVRDYIVLLYFTVLKTNCLRTFWRFRLFFSTSRTDFNILWICCKWIIYFVVVSFLCVPMGVLDIKRSSDVAADRESIKLARCVHCAWNWIFTWRSGGMSGKHKGTEGRMRWLKRWIWGCHLLLKCFVSTIEKVSCVSKNVCIMYFFFLSLAATHFQGLSKIEHMPFILCGPFPEGVMSPLPTRGSCSAEDDRLGSQCSR